MPHQLEKLRTALAELENELESLEEVDSETRSVLEEAAREIQAALDKSSAAELEHHTLAERLRETAQEFGSSHPTLSGIIGRIIDGLGQLGI